MELNRIIFKENGRQYIYNWRCYYSELIRTHRYTLPEGLHAPVLIKNDYCYLLDVQMTVIWDSGISIKDLELLGDLVQEQIYNYGFTPFKNLPWTKIGIDAMEKFRKIKEEEAEETEKKAERLFKKAERDAAEKALIEKCRKEEVYVTKSGSEWIEMGLAEKDRESLWLNLWKEQEICFMFADSNIGKTIYALQMAFHIAETQKVLYFDYEMDYKEFQARYANRGQGKYKIPSGFMRCEPNREIFFEHNSEDILIKEIEKVIKKEGAKVIIIDNLTYISKNAQSSTGVSVLMYRLKLLQKRFGLSILILAHTPKRNMKNELTQNDLAGSKKLFNFTDSGFAIGQSMKDSNLQYVKQLKARGGKIEYGRENVILIERCFTDNWLHFETIGYDEEGNHLKESKTQEHERLKNEIQKLQEEGLSQREMAKFLKVSVSKVNRIIKR